MPEIIPNLHPFAVHFPIALISVSVIFHLAAILFRQRDWSSHLAAAGHWTLWTGTLVAAVAAVTGWFASNSVDHDETGHVAMLLHRSWGLATLAAAIFLAGWDIWRSKGDRIMPLWFLAPLGIVWAMVMSTSWLGSELVYRHGLGVMELPPAVSENGQDHNSVHDQTLAVPLGAEENNQPDEIQPAEHHQHKHAQGHQHKHTH